MSNKLSNVTIVRLQKQMLALLNLVPVAAKWLLFSDFERVAASLRHVSTCAWPDRNSLALPGLHLVSIGEK